MEVLWALWHRGVNVNSSRGPSRWEIREGRGCVGFHSKKRTLLANVFFIFLSFLISILPVHAVERRARPSEAKEELMYARSPYSSAFFP